MRLDISDDKGQVSLEQLLILTAIVGVAIFVGYVLKVNLAKLTTHEKAAANETLNKSR